MTGKSEEPTDRLGRIANAMMRAAEEHPEAQESDRAILMLDNGRQGQIALHGYEDGSEAFVNLLGHVSALAQANGLTLDFIPMEPGGQG